jgi:formate dehydrogenase maturation protein FdhE
MPTHTVDSNFVDDFSVNQSVCPSCGGDPEEDEEGHIYVMFDGYAKCSECSIKWNVQEDVV